MAGKVIFKLQPPATFTEEVAIPVPGGEPVKIDIVFRRMTRDERVDFMKRAADATPENEIDLFMEMVAGWGRVDTEFSREAVELLMQNYEGAVPAILAEFNMAHIRGRRKN